MIPRLHSQPDANVAPVAPAAIIALAARDMARLMPLHLCLDPEGRLRGYGPLIARLFPGEVLLAQSVFSLFALRGPGRIRSIASLRSFYGQKLQFLPRGTALRLRGLVMPLAGGEGMLINLSFGMDILAAVQKLDLTDADFAATDLTMELLYLVEANALVTGEMRALHQRAELARRAAEVEASTDALTGLRNRRACNRVLARLCSKAAPFALMQLDLDLFKQVNDSHGHAAGDQLLQAVAAMLRQGLRRQDCIARIGGDEFLAILPGQIAASRLQALAEDLVTRLRQPIRLEMAEVRISVSIGLLTCPAESPAAPLALLAEVDRALYAAKAAGRGRVHWAAQLPD